MDRGTELGQVIIFSFWLLFDRLVGHRPRLFFPTGGAPGLGGSGPGPSSRLAGPSPGPGREPRPKAQARRRVPILSGLVVRRRRVRKYNRT